MTYAYGFKSGIDLAGSERVPREDAMRQKATAREILKRFTDLPGLILADEVGMGKTFVALAVATSVALGDSRSRPVVVMVPPSLREKWPKDLQFFRERCLSPDAASKLTSASCASAVEFLKLLDDPTERRVKIIFLTHGTMSPARKLNDHWVKLAVIHQAIHRRKHIDDLRSALYRFSGDLLRRKDITDKCRGVWRELLNTPVIEWLPVLKRHGLAGEDDDDPVPAAVWKALRKRNLSGLLEVLKRDVPRRSSINLDEYLKRARSAIDNEISELWKLCITDLRLRLPLLILDEAHHLKNPNTQLASLFRSEEARADAEEVARGPLAHVFERMLFLTATPFQLGHYELCSVLERFEGVSWRAPKAPLRGRAAFKEDLGRIRSALDSAQEAAIRLDDVWGRMRPSDLAAGERLFGTPEEWWQAAGERTGLTVTGAEVLGRIDETGERMKAAEELLRPYVIRHMLPKHLPGAYSGMPRRQRYSGRAIAEAGLGENDSGLSIEGQALLPFLLAARLAVLNSDQRPVFAEGLSSSYEAFLDTRIKRLEKPGAARATDGDDDDDGTKEARVETGWYLDRLKESIPAGVERTTETHPKVAPVVRKVVELWRRGEKVIVFCHYVETGRILRQRISEALEGEISRMGAEMLGCKVEDLEKRFEQIGDRFSKERRLGRALEKSVRKLVAGYPDLSGVADEIVETVRRYVRTPSFLVRYFPFEDDLSEAEQVVRAFEGQDESGMTLDGILRQFLEFLSEHCGSEERARYLQALDKVQTGSHYGDFMSSFSQDELQGTTVGGKFLPNVRLANGATATETRERLMLTFNTPFYPEVLIASSIMAEGVDLQLNCRHIIHHDLCWNPSTLEQRTGRVDRIGAKAERCGHPIQVYLPYIAETQDEKMYRVVMDRERWFKIVMGERYRADVRTTDKLSERLLFPDAAGEGLIFDLRVWKKPGKDK